MTKKTFEHCKPEDVQAVFTDVAAEELAAYLVLFVRPEAVGNPPCPHCGERSRFRWGLTHGQGNCTCGWPGRYYHYIGPREHRYGGYQTLLWYHPDQVQRSRS